jgi:hypothetical protein
VRESAREGDVRQSHLARPVGCERHADMRADELDARPADDGHLDLVERAFQKAAKRAHERGLSGGCQSGRHRHHVLLGDTGLEIAVGMRLGERFGIGRILHVGVERHHRLVGVAERRERHAIGAAR